MCACIHPVDSYWLYALDRSVLQWKFRCKAENFRDARNQHKHFIRHSDGPSSISSNESKLVMSTHPCKLGIRWVKFIGGEKSALHSCWCTHVKAINPNLTTSCKNLSPCLNLNQPALCWPRAHFPKSFPNIVELVASKSNPGNAAAALQIPTIPPKMECSQFRFRFGTCRLQIICTLSDTDLFQQFVNTDANT